MSEKLVDIGLHSDDYFVGEDFSIIKKIDLKGKTILAFKGGGGKGNTYLGVIKELESHKLKAILPLRNDKIKQIIGVSGASAGAITALAVSLGLNSKDIENISRRETSKFLFDDGFEFSDFMTKDTPNPGSYRAVEIQKLDNVVKTRIGFICDKIYRDDLIDSKAKIKLLQKFSNKQNLKNDQEWEASLIQDFLSAANNDIETQDIEFKRRIYGKSVGTKIEPASGDFRINPIRDNALYKLNKESMDKVVFRGMMNSLDLYLAFKKKSHSPIIQSLRSKDKRSELIYNVLYDRGLFCGTYNRKYFIKFIDYFLKLYHAEKYSKILNKYPLGKGGTLNFEEFHEVTGIDLRVGGSNLTAGENVVFSKFHTPFFPVCEAVGLSMNIPGVFKPVYIKNKSLNGQEIKHEGTNLKSGFYGDSGLTNNMPMQTFIDTGHASANEIFGFRVIDGPNPNIFSKSKPYIYDDYKNYKYLNRQLFANYIMKYSSKEGQLPSRKAPLSYSEIPIEKRSLFGTSLFNYLSSILGAVLNTATHNDITDEILPNLVDVYSYDITTLDFTPIPELLKFSANEAEYRVSNILIYSD